MQGRAAEAGEASSRQWSPSAGGCSRGGRAAATDVSARRSRARGCALASSQLPRRQNYEAPGPPIASGHRGKVRSDSLQSSARAPCRVASATDLFGGGGLHSHGGSCSTTPGALHRDAGRHCGLHATDLAAPCDLARCGGGWPTGTPRVPRRAGPTSSRARHGRQSGLCCRVNGAGCRQHSSTWGAQRHRSQAGWPHCAPRSPADRSAASPPPALCGAAVTATASCDCRPPTHNLWNIKWPLLAIMVEASALAIWQVYHDSGDTGLPTIDHVNLTKDLFRMSSFAMSLLLAFRVQRSYERWRDARQSIASVVGGGGSCAAAAAPAGGAHPLPPWQRRTCAVQAGMRRQR